MNGQVSSEHIHVHQVSTGEKFPPSTLNLGTRGKNGTPQPAAGRVVPRSNKTGIGRCRTIEPEGPKEVSYKD